jgi:methionine-gamma-lyase
MIDPSKPYAQQLAVRASELETLCVHAGEGDRRGPLDEPLVLSSAFGFASADEAAGAFRGDNDAYIYGRWSNPTVEALETRLAALERAEACAATASGMAAISGAVLSVCDGSGSHIVAPRAMYAESARLFRERLPKLGVTTTFVDATTGGGAEAYAQAITPATRVLYIETPANPLLGVTDIAAVVALAKSRGIATIADNTFATPFAQQPHASFGVDLVVHSMTKSLGGHGDAIGGAICGGEARVQAARDLVVKGFGGVISPFTAWLVARGLATFALRQRLACETAATLASLLAKHPRVERVYHPSLPSHPAHALASKQMSSYGSILAFELKGEATLETGKRLLEGVRIITHAVSLGDVRSLLTHPASTTHSTMPKSDRERAGISDGLLRLSVGIEAQTDLWRDLEAALDASC